MMKKLIGTLAAATMLCAIPAKAEVELSVADAFPVGHYLSVNAGDYWMKKVTELSDEEIKFNHFTAGQLGKLKELLDVARNNVASITYIPMSSFTARLPLSGVAELPGFFLTSAEGTKAFNKLLKNELIKDEFSKENVVPLFGAVLPQFQVASAKGPIKDTDDFKAIRLRTPGGIMEIAAAELGAVAVPMGGPDMYSAFQRKTVDATLNSYGSLDSYKLFEVINAVSTNGSFGSFAFVYVMNKDEFENLSEENQAILLQAGELAAKNVSSWMDENEKTIAGKFSENGITTYSIDESVLSEWDKRISVVADNWAERVMERKLPGRKVLDSWIQALEESE